MTASINKTRPPPQKRTGLTETGARKAADKPPRSRSREFAMQGLYQHLVGKNDVPSIDACVRELSGFHKADTLHYTTLLHGCIAQSADLDAALAPALDRSLEELSPIERSILWIGTYEFKHCLDVPWRVVINECIELGKEFGGTDGHKYVNGILDNLSKTLRPHEVNTRR